MKPISLQKLIISVIFKLLLTVNRIWELLAIGFMIIGNKKISFGSSRDAWDSEEKTLQNFSNL